MAISFFLREQLWLLNSLNNCRRLSDNSRGGVDDSAAKAATQHSVWQTLVVPGAMPMGSSVKTMQGTFVIVGSPWSPAKGGSERSCLLRTEPLRWWYHRICRCFLWTLLLWKLEVVYSVKSGSSPPAPQSQISTGVLLPFFGYLPTVLNYLGHFHSFAVDVSVP